MCYKREYREIIETQIKPVVKCYPTMISSAKQASITTIPRDNPKNQVNY